MSCRLQYGEIGSCLELRDIFEYLSSWLSGGQVCLFISDMAFSTQPVSRCCSAGIGAALPAISSLEGLQTNNQRCRQKAKGIQRRGKRLAECGRGTVLQNSYSPSLCHISLRNVKDILKSTHSGLLRGQISPGSRSPQNFDIGHLHTDSTTFRPTLTSKRRRQHASNTRPQIQKENPTDDKRPRRSLRRPGIPKTSPAPQRHSCSRRLTSLRPVVLCRVCEMV